MGAVAGETMGITTDQNLRVLFEKRKAQGLGARLFPGESTEQESSGGGGIAFASQNPLQEAKALTTEETGDAVGFESEADHRVVYIILIETREFPNFAETPRVPPLEPLVTSLREVSALHAISDNADT